MKTPSILTQAKKQYLAQKPTATFFKSGWKLLEERLGEPAHTVLHGFFFAQMPRFAIIAFVVAVICGGNVIYVAQYSKPGEPLFAVKRASETVAQIIIGRRPTEAEEASKSGDVQSPAQQPDTSPISTPKDRKKTVESLKNGKTEVPDRTTGNAATEQIQQQSGGQSSGQSQNGSLKSSENPAEAVEKVVNEVVPRVNLPAFP
ncbi:hypothetical protein HY086_06205 [Candidatus Gottesmanbacteria bacterium]|nr:hypothetical protein [Candidatus Gottesmanbacteria bacterium]